MRILVAPDCFTGTLSAAQAASAMGQGWLTVAPDDACDLMPMSDGGPGFVEALAGSLGRAVRHRTVRGPLGESVVASWLLDGSTAYVEAAQACGLELIPPGRRDPARASSVGVGDLILAAVRDGAERVVVGVGGTGCCDGGAGVLAGLGAVGRDANCAEVPLDAGARSLRTVASVDMDGVRRLMDGVELVLASDVDSPLLGARGAAHGFAAQKGATPDGIDELEELMSLWARALGRRAAVDRPLGIEPAVALGAGAGGGIGTALIALGANRKPGLDVVAAAVELDSRVAAADLVLTGEGCFDWQSLRGKVVSGVADAALRHLVPTVVIAGECQVGRREWVGLGVSSVYTCAAEAGSGEAARAEPVRWVRETAARAARSWSRQRGDGTQRV